MSDNPEHGHPKAKIAGEIALALGILAGGTAAGLKIKQHRRARTLLMLEYMREAASLPPLEERLKLFAFESDGVTPDLTTLIGGFVRLASRTNIEHATTGVAIRKKLNLDKMTLGEHLTDLDDAGFIAVERMTGAEENNPDTLLIAGLPDLDDAEMISRPLQEAVTYWSHPE